MGLGVTDLLDDGGGKEVVASAVSCSICLDAVTDNGDRSWAKLQCGHQFHLDCIGSAFNVKGAMQCPNCRKVEKGQWLYGNGSRPLPEFSMDDWAYDDDQYDFSYTAMSLGVGVGVHWCPFSGIARLHSSFDEGELPTNTFNDLLGHNHNPFFVEHTPVSSTSHPCPYIAYIGPIHQSSSTSTSSGGVSDGSSFNNHWSGPTATSEGLSSYAFPSMDVHPYLNNNSWEHSVIAVNSRVGGAEQPSVPSMNQRTARNSSDFPRPGMHPYVFGHSSASRAPSSITSSMVPPYTNPVAGPRDGAPSLQAYFQQSTTSNPSTRTPLVSARRSRSSAQVPPVATTTDQSGNFYFFSSSSSGRTFQEPENPVRDRFYTWELDQQLSYPMSQMDRDSSIWGPFHPSAGGSDPMMRNGSFQQRHGSERIPYHNWL